MIQSNIWIKGTYVGYLKIGHRIKCWYTIFYYFCLWFWWWFFYVFFSQLQMWTRRLWQSWWSQALTMCVIKNSDLGITHRHWAMRLTDWFTGATVPPVSSTCSCKLIRWIVLCSYSPLFLQRELYMGLLDCKACIFHLLRSRLSNQNPRLGT